MDTSETYIKMCDCEEIQKGHKWDYGDWLIAEHGIFTVGTATFGYDISNSAIPPIRSDLPIATIQQDDVDGSIFSDKLIWLPRQDQLQEMVFGSSEYPLKIVTELLESQVKSSFIKTHLTSMEQLWLAFVQKELHNKTWDGDKWQK